MNRSEVVHLHCVEGEEQQRLEESTTHRALSCLGEGGSGWAMKVLRSSD